MTPIEQLTAAGQMYPNAWARVDMFRASRGKDNMPDWPAWCFLPMAAWYAVVTEDAGTDRLSINRVADVSRLAAIGTWRYTKGIYRFDSDVYAALRETVPSGEMPCEVLYRLPEWSVYIETPGAQWLDSDLYGYWAHLEWDANTQRHELRLMLNTEAALVPVPLHMGPWTITEAVDRACSESATQAAAAGFDFKPPPDAVERTAQDAYGLISLLLYLCSDEPEIDDEREPGTSPHRPQPKRTKKGWRLFEAKRPRTWTVGKTMGEKLRANAAPGDGTRTVEPHLRRAHWHGFWSGPRDGERRFRYKFLPPTIVGRVEDEQNV